MARQDIAGLLTGMPSKRPDPMGMGVNSEQQRLAFGAQRAQGMQRGLRSAMGQGPTTSEQLQMAMSKLDLSKPDDLRKLAQIQQATGDLAGAAQTASRIQAMKQAEIEETRAKAREARAEASESRSKLAEVRAQETYEINKIDRLDTNNRNKMSDRRQDEQLAMAKSRELRASVAAEKALSDEKVQLATQGEYRAVLVQDALSKGRTDLADKIEAGMDLATAGTLLTKTSTAVIKPLKQDEKDAYDVILQTPAMQKLLPKALTSEWMKIGTLSDEVENSIFLKTKEISTREQMEIQFAMVKAIEMLTQLHTVDGGGDTEEKTQVDNVLQDLSNTASTGSSNATQRRKRRTPSKENMLEDKSDFADL